jgi:quaternary ammonium compound-resistance protein SugE
MGWLYLFIGGICEIGWAIALKSTDGFTRLWPTLWVVIAGALSVFFIALAVKTLPVGTSYAVWTGIGAIGTAVLGILIFHESYTPLKLVSIALIVIGIAGLGAAGGR